MSERQTTERAGSVEASSFLPTLERARTEGYVPLDPDRGGAVLLAGEPVVTRRLAALVVRARVVRREVRDDLIEMSPRRAAALQGEMPPVPTAFATQSYLVRLRAEGGLGVACTSCDIRRVGYNKGREKQEIVLIVRPDGRLGGLVAKGE